MTFTISGDVATLLGVEHTDGDPVALWLECSQPILVVDSEGRLGGRVRVTVATDGTFTIADLPASVSDIPLYRLVIDSRSLRLAGQKKGLTTGWFPLTADRDLTWIIANYVSTTIITSQVAADVAAAAALGPTNDTATASFVNNPASATAVALSATIAAEVDPIQAELATLPATYATVGRQVGGITSPRISNTVTTFATGHGFTMLGTTAASVADDATTFGVGTQSLAVVTKTDASAASVQKTTLTAFDATGKDLVVTVRVTDVTNLNQLMVYATSDATFASHYVWTIQDGTDSQRIVKSGEWQTITLSFADATVVGTPNRAALTVVRLRAGCTTGNSTTIQWNRVGLTPAPSAGVVSICVDDIYASTYTLMRPILDKYGFGATCYAIPERATAEFVTLENLHKLEDVNGWEIAAHGLTNLTAMTLAEAEADLIASRTWLMENGFKGIDHYAYPQGGFSPAVEAVMRRLYRSGRTIISKHETSPPGNPYRLRSLSVVNTTPVATVTAAITKAAAEKSWFILTLHDIVTSGADTGTEYLQSDLDTICAHIASTGLPVKTVGDVIAGM